MPSRRTVLGAGVAFASLFAINGFAAAGSGARRRRASPSIDALLVDETIEMPRRVAAFIDMNRRALPVVAVLLDAPAQAGLIRVFGKGRIIAGISSGATLFCLERMAWDHGFRLAGRTQMRSSAIGEEASLADVAEFVLGAHPLRSASPTGVRAYRPSRTDGILHAWVMQKSRREA